MTVNLPMHHVNLSGSAVLLHNKLCAKQKERENASNGLMRRGGRRKCSGRTMGLTRQGQAHRQSLVSLQGEGARTKQREQMATPAQELQRKRDGFVDVQGMVTAHRSGLPSSSHHSRMVWTVTRHRYSSFSR